MLVEGNLSPNWCERVAKLTTAGGSVIVVVCNFVGVLMTTSLVVSTAYVATLLWELHYDRVANYKCRADYNSKPLDRQPVRL